MRRFAACILLGLALTGCNRVNLIGHSIAQQAGSWDGDGEPDRTADAPANLVYDALGGRTITVAQGIVDQLVAEPRRENEVYVFDLIWNDAHDGWTDADVEALRHLINTPRPDVCVVVVLPGWTANADPEWSSQAALGRDAAIAVAAERSNTVTADWQSVVDEHPEYIDEDGIHLLTPYSDPFQDWLRFYAGLGLYPVDPTAAAARQSFYWEHANCD